MRSIDRIEALQDWLLRLLGSAPDRRIVLVNRMMRRDASESTGYWLQLTVSVGIATLGLVTGSSAVIIGAMLIAPLMDPIIALALGLAVGSPLLSLRAMVRVGFSVVIAVLGSALITVLIPFHEINAEIAARVSPTLLDLVTAVFCALAGLYACIRGTSDVVTAGAGTAIGISLVPPLCVAGYGLGASSGIVANGAALLFLTNIVAIVTVGGAVFLATGFGRVDTKQEELAESLRESSRLVRVLADRVGSIFDRPHGRLVRFLMPLILLASVAVPLKVALDGVAWDIRVRSGIRAAIERDAKPLLQMQTRVERGQVDVRVVLLGDPADAEVTRLRLDREIRQIAGVEPRLVVTAVADAREIDTSPHVVAVPPPLPAESIERGQSVVRSAVNSVWPEKTSGVLLAIDVGMRPTGAQVRLTHLGEALEAASIETIEKSLAGTLGLAVGVHDVPIPITPLRSLGSSSTEVTRAIELLDSLRGLPEIKICFTAPSAPPRDVAQRKLISLLEASIAGRPSVVRTTARDYELRFSRQACVPLAESGQRGPST